VEITEVRYILRQQSVNYDYNHIDFEPDWDLKTVNFDSGMGGTSVILASYWTYTTFDIVISACL